MFKIFRRFLAYFIDMMVVFIIVQCISGIPFINKNLDKYTKIYNEYLDSFEEYSNFVLQIDADYEDKKLSKKEYDNLIEDYPEYQEILDKYYIDGKLSNKNYKKLVKNVEDEYLNAYKESYYKLDKYSVVFNICYIVVTVLYFVGFNIITDGVTLGKKLVRLKIVNNKDRGSKVSIISYLIRCVMLYQVIYYLFKVIFVNVFSMVDYYTISNIIYDIHSYLLFAILLFISVRADGRGLHDIFANTKVISVDRNGDEIC